MPYVFGFSYFRGFGVGGVGRVGWLPKSTCSIGATMKRARVTLPSPDWICPFQTRQLWGSFFPFLGGKSGNKLKNRKFKKPYIKVVWDSCLWDSGRWDGWGIILGWIPFFFASFGRAKRRKHYVCLLFYQYWTWAQKSQWFRHLFEK